MPEINGISGHTKTVALIGSPVEHSKSPAIHNYTFTKCGVDAIYTVYDVQVADLEHVIPAMKAMGFVGANVTMPLKREVLPYLDELSDAAAVEQAVNVILFKDGKAIGHNTDGAGMMANLRNNGVEVEGATFTILGAGGAGSAIIAQAALDGAKEVRIFVREGGASWNATKDGLIPRLAERCDCNITLHPLEDTDDLKASIAESDILINATNVGMGEGNTDSLVPAEFMRPELVVVDACYNPLMTQLLKNAESVGAKVVTGIGMLVCQAAVGDDIWFGIDMPIDEVTEKFFS